MLKVSAKIFRAYSPPLPGEDASPKWLTILTRLHPCPGIFTLKSRGMEIMATSLVLGFILTMIFVSVRYGPSCPGPPMPEEDIDAIILLTLNNRISLKNEIFHSRENTNFFWAKSQRIIRVRVLWPVRQSKMTYAEETCHHDYNSYKKIQLRFLFRLLVLCGGRSRKRLWFKEIEGHKAMGVLYYYTMTISTPYK